jgi:hypothetical protein
MSVSVVGLATDMIGWFSKKKTVDFEKKRREILLPILAGKSFLFFHVF